MKYLAQLAVLLILAAIMPAVSALGWSGPTQVPTGGNAAAPINVSNASQSKIGGLILNTGGAPNGLIVQMGNVGIGTLSPSAKFSLVGSGSGTGRSFVISDSNNAEKVTILDNGNIGVLKTNPAYPIDVAGDVNATRLCIAGVCRHSWSGVGSSGQWNVSGNNLNYTAGNVSIGTTDSNAKLTVAGGLQIGNDIDCSASKAGTLRWTGTAIEVCDGTAWTYTNPDFAPTETRAGTCKYTYEDTTSYNAYPICTAAESPGVCWGMMYFPIYRDGSVSYVSSTYGGNFGCTCHAGWRPAYVGATSYRGYNSQKDIPIHEYTCEKI